MSLYGGVRTQDREWRGGEFGEGEAGLYAENVK